MIVLPEYFCVDIKSGMSCLYDTVEPSVVDEEMILRSVEEQGPKEEAGKIAKEEGIYFSDVFSLRLDFKSKEEDYVEFFIHLFILIFI